MNQSLITDLANIPDAQPMLECIICKADMTLYIATNFHAIRNYYFYAMHSYRFPFQVSHMTQYNETKTIGK